MRAAFPASDRSKLGLGTRAVSTPPVPDQAGTGLTPVLDMSSTYEFEDTATFAEAAHAKVGSGYVYTRWANPTIDAFEAAVADLEGTEAAEAFATGMGAISGVVLSFCSSGDRIVATRELYGGTFSLFRVVLPRYGIQADALDVWDYEGIERSLPGSKLLYCETIGNPRVIVADLPKLADLARAAGVPLVVDNTFATPILCRPAEHGASVVIHSATKFLGGHHDLLGGIACADPQLIAHIQKTARDLGSTLSPFNAWLALRGLATLHLRMTRICESALAIAHMLSKHSAVERVYYPVLTLDPSKRVADTLLGGRGGGVVGFDISGGAERARRFQENLRLIRRAASLGGTHSLIVHAASITHTQLTTEELQAAGISEGFCRLSVGLEDPDDLIADLSRALDL